MDIAYLLLDRPDVDVNIVNRSGDTAMRYAEIAENTELKELLIRKGAKATDAHAERNIIMRGDTAIIQDCLEDGAEPYFALDATLRSKGYAEALECAKNLLKDKEEWVRNSIYWLAISQGNFKIVEIFVKAGMFFDAIYQGEGSSRGTEKTSLEIAEIYGNEEIIEFLKSCQVFVDSLIQGTATVKSIEQYARIGLANIRTYYSKKSQSHYVSVLQHAIESKNLAIVSALVEAGANIEAPGSLGRTALNFAAEVDSQEILSYLLKKGANLITALKKSYSKENHKRLIAAADIYFAPQ